MTGESEPVEKIRVGQGYVTRKEYFRCKKYLLYGHECYKRFGCLHRTYDRGTTPISDQWRKALRATGDKQASTGG